MFRFNKFDFILFAIVFTLQQIAQHLNKTK